MNKCDLEEMKHLAIKKLEEIVSNPNFEYENTYHGRYRVGGYVLDYSPFCGHTYKLYYAGIELDSCYLFLSYSDDLAVEQEHEILMEERRTNSIAYKVITTIMEREVAAQEAKKCLAIKKQMEEDCAKLKSALQQNTPELSPYMQLAIQSELQKPWWRLW